MKKAYRLTFILSLLVIVLSDTSCNNKKTIGINKSSNEDILSIIERYCKVATVKSDGTFIFEANLANNDASYENMVSMGGVFYDKDGNVQTGGGMVSINNHELLPNNAGSYGFDKVVGKTGLYGDTVTFTLQTPKQRQAASQMLNPNSPTAALPYDGTTVTASIYSPAVVSITNNPGGLTYGASTAITWNTDAKNTNGVVIIAEYT